MLPRVSCLHPPEERQRVYEGRERAREDRDFCSLCGEVLYRFVAELPPGLATVHAYMPGGVALPGLVNRRIA